jgi:putative chitinase
MITAQQLHQLGIGPEWVDPINATIQKFNISTPKAQAAFLGNGAHESNHFRTLEENLNYKAESLMKLWPKRFPSLEEANKYAHQPEKIANHIYSSRGGNRDEASGDGYRFRGGGVFQLTFHDNYWHCGQVLGIDLVMQPTLVRQPMHACLSAGWFWATHGCEPLAEAENWEGLTKKINGGLFGLQERVHLTQQALQALS